jgi:hypothetical protein
MHRHPPQLTCGALLAGLLLVAGCGASYEDPAVDPEENRLLGTSWQLTLVKLADGRRLPPADPADYTVTFVENRRFLATVDGDQCVGHYRSGGRAIAVRLDCPLATTLGPGSIGGAFLSLLSSATHFIMTGSKDELHLESGAAGGTLSFRRLDAARAAR